MYNTYMMKTILQGCTVEYEDDIPVDPVKGTNKESLARPEPGMHMRRTRLDDIPDNFVERMMGSNSRGGEIKKNKQVKIPEGFAVSIAYNKGGYQVVPKEDL
tara:strand:- start:316 stop:621 length:306 start_codon:yes stop_codon:yes gene_type:complete